MGQARQLTAAVYIYIYIYIHTYVHTYMVYVYIYIYIYIYRVFRLCAGASEVIRGSYHNFTNYNFAPTRNVLYNYYNKLRFVIILSTVIRHY